MNNLNKYQKLNNSFKDKLIFHLGSDAGFYSEFNNMVLAIAYCLQNRIKFVLYSEDANFKYKNGWTDYFTPFCNEIRGQFHHKFNTRYNDPFFFTYNLDRIRVLFYRFAHKHTLLTSDVFYKFRTTEFQRSLFSIPELHINGDLRDLTNYIISMLYRFNEDTDLEIQRNIKKINLPDNYIGLHIRGGDKFIEHQLVGHHIYIKKAESLSSSRNAYVLTDDYTIIERLQTDYPSWKFYTLTKPSEKGYFHRDFEKKDANDKKEELIRLFSSMEILRKSTLFIGTLSSNPGMFLGMCMNRDKVYGVDLKDWEIW